MRSLQLGAEPRIGTNQQDVDDVGHGDEYEDYGWIVRSQVSDSIQRTGRPYNGYSENNAAWA